MARQQEHVDPTSALVYNERGWRSRDTSEKRRKQLREAQLVLVVDPPGYRLYKRDGQRVSGLRITGRDAHRLCCEAVGQEPHL
jgi:hypothetical protein